MDDEATRAAAEVAAAALSQLGPVSAHREVRIDRIGNLHFRLVLEIDGVPRVERTGEVMDDHLRDVVHGALLVGPRLPRGVVSARGDVELSVVTGRGPLERAAGPGSWDRASVEAYCRRLNAVTAPYLSRALSADH